MQWSHGIREAAYSRLESLRDEKIESITRWVHERNADLRMTSQRRSIVDYLQLGTAPDQPRGKRALAALRGLQHTYSYQAVFLSGVDGQPLLSTDHEGAPDQTLPARRGALLRVFNTRAAVVAEDVLASRVHGQSVMLFAGPVLAPGSGELLGALGILVDLDHGLYPWFSHSEHLGKSGEVLLANKSLLAQSPLKYASEAVGRVTLGAEPIRRGASGQRGRIAAPDYRSVPVMAAYGFIPELGWGLVIKQDLDEIEAPVRQMAYDVVRITLVVLVLSILCGLVLARTISLPAQRIAAVAEKIGSGDVDALAVAEGPLEIRRIAESLNAMLGYLREQMRIRGVTAEVYSAAGKNVVLSEMLAEALPILMRATRSQAGVVYLVPSGEEALERVWMDGLAVRGTPRVLSLRPAEHQLARVALEGEVSVWRELPSDTPLRVATTAGLVPPRALLSVPLMLRGRAVGVIGLASLYDYGEGDMVIAQELRANLGQYVEAALASARTERMARDLDQRNQELKEINDALQRRTTEAQAQAAELRQLADELAVQREQVLQSDRLKSAFLSNMSHELRTPLNSVLALSALMLESGTGEDVAKERAYLEVIERNGRNLLHLINDILDLSRIESGRVPLSVTQFELAELVASVMATIRPLAEEKGLALRVEVPSGLQMCSDRDKLQQILLNLLGNAEKFTASGWIGLRVVASGSWVSFEVDDTGMGIPQGELSHIFEEFRQVDGSLSRQHEGTGLGLAISARLAELMQGRLSVSSELGEGSTFVLDMPLQLARADTSTAEVPAAPALVLRPLRRVEGVPRLLLVEDQPDNLLTLRAVLAGLDAVLIEAHDGVEAVDKVRELRPDLVIMDIQLPRLSGLDATRQIRADPALAHIPILALTGKAMKGDREMVLAAGCDAYLTKPVEAAALREAIALWLGRGQPDELGGAEV